MRDRIQGMLLEATLTVLHERWIPREEVAVWRPVRGVIDLLLRERHTDELVAGEAHSLLHTVEGQLRHAHEKADGLPSAPGWPWQWRTATPRVSSLLILRSCSAMHELVRSLPHVFAAAYPADTEQAAAALTTPTTPWPGSAIVWVRVDGARTRMLEGLPRNLRRDWDEALRRRVPE